MSNLLYDIYNMASDPMVSIVLTTPIVIMAAFARTLFAHEYDVPQARMFLMLNAMFFGTIPLGRIGDAYLFIPTLAGLSSIFMFPVVMSSEPEDPRQPQSNESSSNPVDDMIHGFSGFAPKPSTRKARRDFQAARVEDATRRASGSPPPFVKVASLVGLVVITAFLSGCGAINEGKRIDRAAEVQMNGRNATASENIAESQERARTNEARYEYLARQSEASHDAGWRMFSSNVDALNKIQQTQQVKVAALVLSLLVLAGGVCFYIWNETKRYQVDATLTIYQYQLLARRHGGEYMRVGSQNMMIWQGEHYDMDRPQLEDTSWNS